MTAQGYNPINHRCPRDGCYIEKSLPKSEWFYSIFPGKISFSDLDRIVEIAGRGLVFEWKSPGLHELKRGQDIMWRRLTRGKLLTVFCCAGDVKEMKLTGYAVYFNGGLEPWREAGLLEFTERLKAWVQWALDHSLVITTVHKHDEPPQAVA